MVRRSARKRQAECDIHTAAEARDFDGRHANVVIRRNDDVEFTADRTHKYRIGRKRTEHTEFRRDRRQQFGILTAKPAAVTRVRIHGTERNPRLRDIVPVPQALARERDRIT